MGDLVIFRPPQALRSGDDVLGPRTILGLNKAGLSVRYYELSSQWWARKLWFSRLPGRRTIFEYGPALAGLLSHRLKIGRAAAVWINGPASPLNKNCWFERAAIRAGKPFIFHLQDDWFSMPYIKDVASARVRLASLVVVPTEALKERIMGLFPDAKVIVLEEAIDVERLKPVPVERPSDLPFLVWTGHVTSMADLKESAGLLSHVYASHPFKLRIVSGENKPVLDASFPWEWFPFNPTRESELLSGATAGLAPLEDSSYARCKGGYKVKTYLAAGIPVVASPVGHHCNLIRSGENGILAGTPEEWEAALLKLLQDPSFARRIGEAGRESAEKRFSHEVQMPVWAAALKSHLKIDIPE